MTRVAKITYADTTARKVFTLPPNSVITDWTVITDTAFTNATTLDVGSDATDNIDVFVNGATITSVGAATVTPVAAGLGLQNAASSTDVYIKAIEGGSTNTAGVAYVVCEYAQL